MKGKPIEKELLSALYIRHTKNNEMVSDLAREYNLRPATLYYALKRLGPIIRGYRKSSCTWHKLFPVKTPAAAYIYGLWMADGCWTGKKITIKLHIDDKYLLDFIQLYLDANKVYKDGNAYKLVLDPGRTVTIDKAWFPRNKSINGMQFPTLEPSLYSHFIRGFFDGDGSISTRKCRPNQVAIYWCCTNLEFLISLNAALPTNIPTTLYAEDRSKLGYQTMYTLRVGTHASRLELFKYLYKDSGLLFMKRKYSKFAAYVNTVLTAKQAVV